MLNFAVTQLNSPFDDSAFFVRDIYRKRAYLLDCGRLGGISHADLLSVGDIFVSHTHMDHFVGFDRIVRGALNSAEGIRVFGPPGFIGNVEGKFRGYTWNLTGGYSFFVEAVELSVEGESKRALFKASDGFLLHELEPLPYGAIDLGEGFSLKTELFDHRTLSAGYRIEEPIGYSVDREKLLGLAYKQGPWLSALKAALAAGKDLPITTLQGEKEVTKGAFTYLEEFIEVKRPQVISYITDCAPTEENVEKAVAFADKSTLLIIEAPFLAEDEAHAKEKNHLTLPIAKEIFRRSSSDYVRFTHFASRYENDKGNFLQEVYKGLEGRVHTKNTR